MGVNVVPSKPQELYNNKVQGNVDDVDEDIVYT